MDDYVKPVAKAYGDSNPEIRAIAKRQLDLIKAVQDQLQNQAYTIRQLLYLVPAPPPQVVPKPASDPSTADVVIETLKAAADHAVNGAPSITDEQKQLAREIWDAEMKRSGRDMTAQEVVDLMLARGMKFEVAQPAASIGTTLAALRRMRQTLRSRYVPTTEKDEAI